MVRGIFIFLVLWPIFLPYKGMAAEKAVTIHCLSPQSDLDRRQLFVHEIITAVMDSTASSHGPYNIKPIPKMTWHRLDLVASQHRYPNMVIRVTGNIRSIKAFEAVPIPINRGIVGYRIFLIPDTLEDDFTGISDLKDLIASGLTPGQGRWADVGILKANGIDVVVGSNYEGLFAMLMAGRFDFFPRGVNEAFEELEARSQTYPDMRVEKTMAFYYPLPRVLATTKGNTEMAERIEAGLRRIFANGTHKKIWLKYNKKWVEKADLSQRKIIRLENPDALPSLPYDQKIYWYQPGERI